MEVGGEGLGDVSEIEVESDLGSSLARCRSGGLELDVDGKRWYFF